MGAGTQKHIFWPALTCSAASKPLLFLVVALSPGRFEREALQSGALVSSFSSPCSPNPRGSPYNAPYPGQAPVSPAWGLHAAV